MRIAQLYAGPYNGNEQTVTNHQNYIGRYDTYVSCFEQYQSDWINSGIDILELYLTPTIKFEETDWSKYRNDKAGESGFWQFWNLRSVINSIEDDYDFYIKSRCDLIFDLNNANIWLQPNTMYCPQHYFDGQCWDTQTLLNDQFYFGDKSVMNAVASFSTDFYKTDRHTLNYCMASNERNLRTWMNEHGIKVEPIDITYHKSRNNNKPSGETGDYTLENRI